ncbi:MAG: RnfABCDGE type electron transport complex subunit A [Oscillospiraceae bacterium]|jgi:electron transport complex protein RnfA|nr:RnfABCDGE type electron transport complex subunit A [Oscillospiraceae bacterium]MDE6839989.1 RnfABCDGE type electron transport complex subunit A [Oscillospiraceae bacterium]
MIDFKALLAIVMAAVLVNNYVLAQFLGICPFLGVSKKLDQAAGMSVAVIFVMLLATAVTYPIQYFVLNPNGLGYLQTIVFILVIAALVQLVEIILKKYIPALHASLGVYLPLITTNCAVLGVCISNVDNYLTATGGFGGGFVQAMFNSLGSGLGFLLAMVLFSGVRSRVDKCKCPECFKGMPITLISAAIVSVSFMGFAGIVENLLG